MTPSLGWFREFDFGATRHGADAEAIADLEDFIEPRRFTTALREILIRYTLAPPTDAKSERGHVRNITNVPRRKARIVVTARTRAAHDSSRLSESGC